MKKNYTPKLLFIIFCFSISFTFIYVKKEAPVYTFDYSGYFEMFKSLGLVLEKSFISFLKEIYLSIQYNDYNYSSLFLTMPFYLIFGNSRISYITGLIVSYLLPTIIISEILVSKLFNQKNRYYKKEIIFPLFTLILMTFYTRFWSPTLRGLSDISGVLFISLSYLILISKPTNKKENKYWMILLGTTIYVPFLFRRWYLYFVVSFLISSIIIDLYDFVGNCKKNKQFNKELFWTYFINYAIIGTTIVTYMLVLQFPFIKRIITENYGNLYSSYQISKLEHIKSLLNEFGLVVIVLVAVSIIASIIKKKYRKEIAFCTLNFLVFYFLFTRVQLLGVHHYLGIGLWIIIIVIIGIRIIYESISNKPLRLLFLFVIIMLFGTNFFATFIIETKIPLITQKNKYHRLTYDNLDELNRLIEDLTVLVTDDSINNVKFSVIAESGVISDNIIDLMGDNNIKDNIVYANHIDSRDDITINALLTQYVVVTDIPQTVSSPNGQHVISVPNNYIYNGKGIGGSYSRFKGPYILDNKVLAYIYKKNNSIPIGEAQNYFREMFKYNSSWEAQYDEFSRRLLSSDVMLGSYWGSFKKIDKKRTLLVYPGVSNTRIKIPIYGINKKLKLNIYMLKENGKGNAEITLKTDTKEIYKKIVSTTKSDKITIDLKNRKELTIEANGSKSLKNDWVYIDYELE